MNRASSRFNNGLRYRDVHHPNQTQFTPRKILSPIRSAFGGEIALDPCTEPNNPVGATRFYTERGLEQPWDAPSIFVNPPYGKAREPWVERCISVARAGSQVVLLIPSHTDTRIFHRAAETASSFVFIKGRVKFGSLRPNRRQQAASHPSVLIGWNVDLAPCAQIGLVMTTVRLGQGVLL